MTNGTGFFLPTYSPINHGDYNRDQTTFRSCAAGRGQADQYRKGEPASVTASLSPALLPHKMQQLALQQPSIPFPEQSCEWMLPPASPYSSFSANSSCLSTEAALSEPCSLLGPCYSNSSSIPSSTQYLPPGYPVSTPPSLQHYNLAQAMDQEAQELQLLQQQEAEVDAAIRNLLALRQQLSGMMTPAAPPAPAAVLAPPVSQPAFTGPTSVSRATAALAVAHPLQPVASSMLLAAAVPAGPTAAAQLHIAQLQARQQQLLGVEQQLQLQLQQEVAHLWAIV